MSSSSNSIVDTFLERITMELDIFTESNLTQLKVAVEKSFSILNNSRQTLKFGGANNDLSEPWKRSYQHEELCCDFGNSSNSIDCHFPSEMKSYLTALHSEQDESFLSFVKTLDQQNSSDNAFDEELGKKDFQLRYFYVLKTSNSKPIKKNKMSVCESLDPVPEPEPSFSKQNVNISREIPKMSFMEDEAAQVKPTFVVQQFIDTLDSSNIIGSGDINPSKVSTWKQLPPSDHRIRALKVANAFTSEIIYICSVIHELTTDAKNLENLMKQYHFAYDCLIRHTSVTKRKTNLLIIDREMKLHKIIPTLKETKSLVSEIIGLLIDYFKTVINAIPKKLLHVDSLIEKEVEQKYSFLSNIYTTLNDAGSSLKLSVFLDEFENIAKYLTAIQNFHNQYHKTGCSSDTPNVVDLNLS